MEKEFGKKSSEETKIFQLLEKSFVNLRKVISNWIGKVSFFSLFLSLWGVKVVDTLLAFMTYLYRPSIFIARETNPFLYGALVNGNLFPYLIIEGTVYLLFALIALATVKLSDIEEEFTSWVLAIPFIGLGALIIWLYSVTMSTNIINGILALGVTHPVSAALYVITGFPLAWLVTKYGWNLENRYITAFMVLVMFVIGFQI